METIVAAGHWIYGGVNASAVCVVMLDYDFWYAVGEADNDLEEDEFPQLNPAHRLYYVRYRPGWPAEGQPFWPDSQGFHTVDEGIAAAEAAVPGPIAWQ
ncbi:hypothetical protein AB0B68_02315 [Micromonospora sp. NPDC049049]|uniref:hypothetical protein n=1 Tax=Micromonospora sp. NPDC049049 TaxID=3155495 RepID=UPI0033F21235